MNPRYPAVAARAGHRCEYCRAPEAAFNLPFEVEHIVPKAHHGGDANNNQALACRSCNLHKSDFIAFRDEVGQQEERLFHPREDIWEDHFSVESETGAICGRTAVGRATVACLRMNNGVQLAARRLWIRLGLCS